MENVCRISRAQNGFTVSMRDPAIEEANRKRDLSTKSAVPTPWRDPHVEYVFEDVESVLKFLKKTLPTAMTLDEYSSTFDKAMAESDDD